MKRMSLSPTQRSGLLRYVGFAIITLCVAAGCSRITGFAESKPPPELEEGRTYLRTGDRNSAVAKFNDAIAADPKNPAIYGSIMIIAGVNRQRDLVDRYYTEALEAARTLTSKQQAEIHLHAGMAYLRLRDFEPAIQANAKALELAPDNIHALNGLGYSYAEAGKQLDKAVEYVTRAIELARKENVPPRMMGALVDSLGWAHYQAGRYQEALKTLAEAASLAPDMAEIQYHLGLAYEKRGRLTEARVALARAVTSEPEMSLYKQDLQRVTARLKEQEKLKDPLEVEQGTNQSNPQPSP